MSTSTATDAPDVQRKQRRRFPSDDRPRAVTSIDLGSREARAHAQRVLAERGESFSAAVRRLLIADGILPAHEDWPGTRSA